MKTTACACVLGLFATIAVPITAMQLDDSCKVLTVDEIKSALGRKDRGAARAGRASGGYSDCRYQAAGAGDVRITLSPSMRSAKEDFDLKPQIYADEGKKFEKLAGIGDGAYYWDDTLEFRVGSRLVSLWINRTPRTEAAAAVKTALATLAKRAADRLRTSR